MQNHHAEFIGAAVLWEIHFHVCTRIPPCRDHDLVLLPIELTELKNAIGKVLSLDQDGFIDERAYDNIELFDHFPVRIDDSSVNGVEGARLRFNRSGNNDENECGDERTDVHETENCNLWSIEMFKLKPC